MARGVEEGDHALLGLHVVRADVLGDSAGLAVSDAGLPDVVKKGGLAVIYVSHDGDDRSAGLGLQVSAVTLVEDLLLKLILLPEDYLVAHLLGDELRGLLVDDLVDGGHGALLHHELDDLGGLHCHLLRELADGDGLADDDVAGNRSGRLLEAVLVRLPAGLDGLAAPGLAAAVAAVGAVIVLTALLAEALLACSVAAAVLLLALLLHLGFLDKP